MTDYQPDEREAVRNGPKNGEDCPLCPDAPDGQCDYHEGYDAGFRIDTDNALRERIRQVVETAVNTAYGTDGRHAMLATHVAAEVVDGKPMPWDLAAHFGRW